MNQPPHDELDAWLRDEFEGPVPDDGFATRVANALPRRTRRREWLLPAAATAGALLTCLALAPAPLADVAAREWLTADLGASSALLLALVLGMGLLGCAWALEEGP